MAYRVNEIFYSIQGEGRQAGRPAVFVRFAGCNLWSGRPEDKASSACPFCDTDFRGGRRHDDAESLADAALEALEGRPPTYCVLTGGEPALQATAELVDALQDRKFAVAIETNGTRPVPEGIDWITLSPKTLDIRLDWAHEIKLLWPLPAIRPADLDNFPANPRYLQPIDGPDIAENLRTAVEFCLANPRWRLSAQNHKTWGLR